MNELKASTTVFWSDSISHFFRFNQLGTNYRTELLASLTTFMATAPIMVVNAHILGNAVFLNQPGDLFDQILVSSVLCTAIASLLIGLSANYPFVLGPGTGLVAPFTYSIVLNMGLNWRLAFTAALVAGILLTMFSISRLRHHLNDAIPQSLKQAIVVGLGLFIAYIALSGKADSPTLGAGIIVSSAATTTALGSLKQPATIIAILGILFTLALAVRRVKSALLVGIFVTAALGWLCGVAPLPHGIIALPQLPLNLLGQAIGGMQYLTWSQLGNFFAAVFILLFVSLSDTISSFNVLGQQLDRIKPDGELYQAKPALLSSTLGTVFGSLFGSTPVIPYLESASGIFTGGRSGFVTIVVALLLLISALFAPLLAAIPAFATAPVLIMIGVLMMSCVRFIDWSNLSEAIPAFLVILIMPLTFSVADGIAVGFIAHAVVNLAQKKLTRQLPPLAGNSKRSSLVLAAISIAYFVVTA